MTVKLTKKDLDEMSGKAGDIQGNAKDAQKIVKDAGAPNLTGFATQSAITEVSDQWDKKTGRCAGRWEYFALALKETGEHIVATDRENSFHFPNVNVGVKDLSSGLQAVA